MTGDTGHSGFKHPAVVSIHTPVSVFSPGSDDARVLHTTLMVEIQVYKHKTHGNDHMVFIRDEFIQQWYDIQNELNVPKDNHGSKYHTKKLVPIKVK